MNYLNLLLNILGIFLAWMFFTSGVSLSSDLPAKINPGEAVLITVTIKKDNVTGFAKFSQNLPEGFYATVVEAGNSTFSFKNQKLQFIWVSMPTDQEIKVSYKITTDMGVEGVFDIDGTFDYIFDNERQSANLETRQVQVGEAPSLSSSQGKAGVRINRSTSENKDMANTFIVEMNIFNSAVGGFAKLEETIPDGFIASEIESQGGIFSFEDQVLKVIWMDLPQKEELLLSYQLESRDVLPGKTNITGTFSYLIEEELVTYQIKSSKVEIQKEDANAVPVVVITDPNKDESVTSKKKDEKINIPQPSYEISYRVQVAAGHRLVENTYFPKKFQLTEEVIIHNHEGWIKYTFGNFKEYKDCRDERNKVWQDNKITDAFVTSYNAGTRITVQEALMITNQLWYN